MKFKLILAFLLLPYFNTLCQETVFVKAKENGNGLIKERAENCFLITPSHVVLETLGDIKIISKNRIEHQGKLVESFEPDLAIIKLESSSDFDCKPWPRIENINETLENISTGFLEYLDELGTTHLLHVNITSIDQESIAIVPQNIDNQLVKGLSGSSFYSMYDGKKVLLGMLLNIEADLKTGYVYQIDDIDRMLAPFFEIEATKAKSLGILILKDDTIYTEVSNTLIMNLSNSKKYHVLKKLPNPEFLYKEFRSIVEGRFNRTVPQKIKENVDEVLLGEITISKSLNSNNLYKINSRLSANLYSSSDLALIKNINANGKGLNSDTNLAYDQSIKSLIRNLENQLK